MGPLLQIRARPTRPTVGTEAGDAWVCSQGLRKIQEVQQMFSVKRRWKPQELHLFFFFLLKCKFICETMFFPLSCSLLKLPNRNAGQSVEPLRLQRASPCARP